MIVPGLLRRTPLFRYLWARARHPRISAHGQHSFHRRGHAR